jgi:hypothetical protein
MTLLWAVTGVSLLVALLAWRAARQAVRRAEQLSQMYWELKYQHGELRAHLQLLSGPDGASPAARPAASQPAVPREHPADVFVPLASLKR